MAVPMMLGARPRYWIVLAAALAVAVVHSSS